MVDLVRSLDRAAKEAAKVYGEVFFDATESRTGEENLEIAEKQKALGRNPFELASETPAHKALSGSLESLRPITVRKALLDGARVVSGLMRSQARSMFTKGTGQLARSVTPRVGK